MVKEHLGCVSPLTFPLPTSSLSISQASQEMVASPELEDNFSMSQDGELSVTLEEASQKILCDEVYRSPMDQAMDTEVCSQKHLDKAKQKRSNSDSPRQPLRQINNTMQLEGRSPGPSKLSLNNRDQRTRVSKFND